MVRAEIYQMGMTTSQIVQAVILKIHAPSSWFFHTAQAITRQDYKRWGSPKSTYQPPPASPRNIIIYTELHDSALPKGDGSHFLIQDQSEERKASWQSQEWGQTFSFQPFQALKPGFLPKDFWWEGGRGEGCSLGSQQPQPQAAVLDAGGKWSLLSGSVRETAMMMGDNQREETEGKKVIGA